MLGDRGEPSSRPLNGVRGVAITPVRECGLAEVELAAPLRRSHSGRVRDRRSQLAGNPAALPREQLGGLIERVTFHNSDSGFCVLRVKVRGQRDLATLIGQPEAATSRKRIWRRNNPVTL